MTQQSTDRSPRLFKHIKGQLYLYKTEARHSETLEEYVVYEARYANDIGRDWIRPKSMFFETLTYNGSQQPRFKEIQIETIATSSEDDLPRFSRMITPLLAEHFTGVTIRDVESRLKLAKFWLLQVGVIDGDTCGFKVGYEVDSDTFYSWLGGVSSKHAGLGVGSRLMHEQAQWCRNLNYKKIQTKTLNKWKRMLLLNLKNDFEITGTYTNAQGELKLVLERRL